MAMDGRGWTLANGPRDLATEGVVASARLMYREDDDNFKRRLNTAIQFSWVYNTAVTILIVVGIFYVLDYNLAMGIMLGVLIAMVSNLHYTLSRVTKAARWEVYKNRVVMPRGFRGGERTIAYGDIKGIERHKSMTGEAVTIVLASGERIVLDVGEQQKPLSALELAYRQFARASGTVHSGITIPVSMDDEAKGPG